MQEIDLKKITYKINIFNVSQETKVIQEKIETLLAEEDKVFEALFGNQQANSYSDIKHPMLIVEGDANRLYAVLKKFKDYPNLKWNLLNSELLNNWLIIRKIEEKEIFFENGKEEKSDIENEMPTQGDYLIFMNEIKNEFHNLNVELKNIENSVQDFAYKDNINKDLHEELQHYKAGLRHEFIAPILKSIIREYDRTIQQYDFYQQKAQKEPQSELFAKLLKEFNIISLSLLDLLDDYNLVPYFAKEGDEYSSREHKILKIIATDDPAKDGKIEKCVTCGFNDTGNGRLLRIAEVNIYKIEQNK